MSVLTPKGSLQILADQRNIYKGKDMWCNYCVKNEWNIDIAREN